MSEYAQLNWLFEKKYWLLRHGLFWFLFYIDYMLAFFGITDHIEFDLHLFFTIFLSDFILVYFSVYVLIPRYFLNRKWFKFIIYSILSLVFHAVATFYFDIIYEELPYGIVAEEFNDSLFDLTHFINSYLFAAALLLSFAGSIKIGLHFMANQKKLQDLKFANAQTELAFLKNQMNPHFLFNALNTIHVQSEKYPDRVGDSIALLSDLLRYQLYDGAKENVPLQKEINYLKDYLEFDQHRKNKSNLKFEVHGSTLGVSVAPFIFIPFIENAVKHGLNEKGETDIKVCFEITKSQLYFRVKNAKPENAPTHVVGGIGLSNVKRRLDLIYPGKYRLDIHDESTYYEVTLVLKLEEYELKTIAKN